MSSPLPTPREFAAIDLGSNSFHLIVARIVNGSLQTLSRVKRRVRLAEGLDLDHQLSQDAITRGVECLALFAKRLQGFPQENVRVVGTYTLRKAVNNADFLAQAKVVFPYPIEIISGEQEAHLIYAGVSHTQAEMGRKLVVDIGGGSTEMCIGDGFLPLRAKSCDMGCVSFAKRFFAEGKVSQQAFDSAYQTAMETIADLATEYRKLGWQNVFGSSGTIKTVSKVLKANGYHNGLITEERLQYLIKTCLAFPSLYDIQLKGLIDERADVLVPGLAILLALFHTYQIDKMCYSDGALREGVMYSWENDFQVENIRQRTADALAKQFQLDLSQAKRVGETALTLFAQVKSWRNKHQIEELRAMLKWASSLYEIGICINHNNVHRHSAYMIANLNLPGFDGEQQNLLSTLVRYHLASFKRSDLQSTTRFQYRDILTLLRLFRLATVLNRSRQASVIPQQMKLLIEKNHWTLQFDDHFLTQNPLILADLEEEQRMITMSGFSLVYS